jgi:flagellar biosynthesis anti-sigma factor FlgM
MRIDPSLQYLGNEAAQGANSAKEQQKVASSQVSGTNEPESNSSDGDTVQLSGALSQVQQLKAQLDQTPDMRSGRVAALQQQLAQGTYQPSNEQIAGAMFADLFGSGGQG